MEGPSKVTVEIPNPPSGIPSALAGKWRETYQEAFIEAVDDFPNDHIQHKQTAMREANRLLKVREPQSYTDAMSLPDWQVAHRQEKGGVLNVVTFDGKKFKFPVPDVAGSKKRGDKGPEANT